MNEKGFSGRKLFKSAKNNPKSLFLKNAGPRRILQDFLWHAWFRGTETSTLDLIFTKEEDDVKNIKVLPSIGGSDHGILYVNGKVDLN